MSAEIPAEPSNATAFRLMFKRMMPYAMRYRGRLIGIALLAIITSALQKTLILFLDPVLRLIFPSEAPEKLSTHGSKIQFFAWFEKVATDFRNWFLDWVLGSNGVGDDSQKLWVLGRVVVLIVIVAFFAAVTQYIYTVVGRNLALRMVADLRRDVCEHLLRLSLRYHGKRKMGDLLSRLTNDVNAALRSANIFFDEVLQMPFMIIFTLATAFIGSPTLTLAALVLIPFISLPVAFFAKRVRRGSYKSSTAMGQTTTVMEQMLAGIRIVKAFQMERREMQGLDQANDNFIRKTMKMVRAKAMTEGFLILMTMGGTALVLFGIGLMQIYFHTFPSFNAATIFLASIVGIYANVKTLTRMWYAMLESSGSALRLLQVTDIEPELKDNHDAVEIERIHEQIEVQNVHFAYDKDHVLSEISFKVKAGTRVAFVGPSGAGKSTLMDLLARFFDPSSGTILVDGKDLRHIRMDSWLKQIAIVSQQPFVFNTSIRENIRYGRPEASDEEVEAAAKAAHVDAFALKLPEGLDTIVGERGARLSGGELQRITIARAIAKNASVLLLDEATSSLDSASEKAVQSALDNLMQGKTTFVIAHRLSTVRHADLILVLDHGHIVEKGTHEELLALNGVYRRLYNIQFQTT